MKFTRYGRVTGPRPVLALRKLGQARSVIKSTRVHPGSDAPCRQPPFGELSRVPRLGGGHSLGGHPRARDTGSSGAAGIRVPGSLSSREALGAGRRRRPVRRHRSPEHRRPRLLAHRQAAPALQGRVGKLDALAPETAERRALARGRRGPRSICPRPRGSRSPAGSTGVAPARLVELVPAGRCRDDPGPRSEETHPRPPPQPRRAAVPDAVRSDLQRAEEPSAGCYRARFSAVSPSHRLRRAFPSPSPSQASPTPRSNWARRSCGSGAEASSATRSA
jgi:hypothetical protein